VILRPPFPQPPRPRQNRRAFTLIELMVVITLIAVLTAVILPEMRGTLEETALRSAARELVSACQTANARAVATGRPQQLVLDATAHRFRIETARGGPGEAQRPRSASEPESGKLDPRIAVEVRLQEPPLPGAPAGIEFQADGTVTAADIILRDRTGFGLVLRLNPVTARPTLKDLARK